MPRILELLVVNVAYAFIVVGIAWLAVAAVAGSVLVLWPVIACLTAGVQLKLWPERRLTWAWAVSTAVMGFLLAAYQFYTWVGFLGGAFSSLATASLVGFAILTIAHIFLFYAGVAKPSVAEEAPA